MSNTWKQEKAKRTTAPQKTVDRLREAEAEEEIREALQAPQEASRVS